MKLLSLLLGFVIFFSSCSNGNNNFFSVNSSDCNKTKSNCLVKCKQSGKGQNRCIEECEKVRGMCEAIKTKGCLQECNIRYGKNTQAAEQCKRRCQNL